jgi:hypothetical protein
MDPEALAAAAKAALGKPKAKAKAKAASVAEVIAMAEERFGKGRPRAKLAVKKTQLNDTVRRELVKPKGRPKGSRNKTLERETAVAAIAAA